MDRPTITAFFEDRENANSALLRLRRHGISDQDVTISPEAAVTGYAEDMPAHAKRYWAALEALFGGTVDLPAYTEAVRRGLVMVTAHAAHTNVDDVASVLERYGSIDLSEHETTWRAEGWTGGSAIAGRTVAFSDTNLTPSNSAASPWDEAASDVLHEASASGAYRNSTKGVETTSSTIDHHENGLKAKPCTLDGTRAEGRGTVRIHRGMIGTFEDVIHHHGAGPERRESTAQPSKESRTSTTASTALTDGTAVQRAKDLEVVGSDGQHVGIIDHVAGTVISLKGGDPASNGIHHVIPTMWVQFIDDKVTLKFTADDAMSLWTVA